jgi:hypothetical protein
VDFASVLGYVVAVRLQLGFVGFGSLRQAKPFALDSLKFPRTGCPWRKCNGLLHVPCGLLAAGQVAHLLR